MYSFAIRIASWIHRVGARFIPKWKLQVTGQSACFNTLKGLTPERRVIWFHCASLGEFEQCRPVIEKVARAFPDIQILLSFFSPSGYEVRKNFSLATAVVYLPWDTPENARRFADLARPVMALFVKYEYWFNFFKVLRSRKVPLISISSIFLPRQVFFRFYGGFFRSMLSQFSHFFVQDEGSRKLLSGLGIQEVTVAGDTRFDRVSALAGQPVEIEIAGIFAYNKKVMVAGSVWSQDLEVLIPFINRHTELRFIIAPHDIGDGMSEKIAESLQRTSVLFSRCQEHSAREADVLIIDNIGMLSSLYRYGQWAWVGGSFGKGLHNILEPACYGLPVFFGDRNYRKFREANELMASGGAFAIHDLAELEMQYSKLTYDDAYEVARNSSLAYVKRNLGATEKIMSHIRSVLTLRAW